MDDEDKEAVAKGESNSGFNNIDDEEVEDDDDDNNSHTNSKGG